MLAGLTYDLRRDYLDLGYSEEDTAEFDKPETIEAIERELAGLGFRTTRIGHVRNLTEFLAAGQRADIVFNIAEGLRGYGREAQVPALLEAYDIPYVFSDPLTLALSLHKGLTKRVVRDAGIPTPDFMLVAGPDDIPRVRLPFPLFVKPVAEGTGKGVTAASKVATPDELAAACRELLARFRQPVLVETFLPGREFTVGIVGTGRRAEVVGVMEVLLRGQAEPSAYSYDNKEHYESRVRYRLAGGRDAPIWQGAARVALDAWRVLECRDGGRVDIRQDGAGAASFIEVNPLAGLNPVHSDLPILCGLAGLSFGWLIERIMRSAMDRAGLPMPTPAMPAAGPA
jgi:D-alanine-D-alanine ligase